MTQHLFDLCQRSLQAHPSFDIAQREDHYLSFVHTRGGEGVAMSLLQLEEGWLSILAPAIGYAQGLDAEMIGQVFAQSWVTGPLRFVLGEDGLYMRTDLPLIDDDLSQARFLELALHMGQALHNLLDHRPEWARFHDSTALSAEQLTKALDQAQIEHEYLPKRDLYRLIHDEQNLFNPTALEHDTSRGLVRIIYGLSPTESPELEALPPTAAANMLRANDQLQLFRLVYSQEQGGIMLLAELPFSWIDANTLSAAWARLRLDILRLERSFSGLHAALGPIFKRLLELRTQAQVDDALIATTLRSIAQGQEIPPKIEAHDDLADAIVELADVIFRLLPKQQPRAMIVLPMQIDLVERQQATLESLLNFISDYALAAPEPLEHQTH